MVTWSDSDYFYGLAYKLRCFGCYTESYTSYDRDDVSRIGDWRCSVCGALGLEIIESIVYRFPVFRCSECDVPIDAHNEFLHFGLCDNCFDKEVDY